MACVLVFECERTLAEWRWIISTYRICFFRHLSLQLTGEIDIIEVRFYQRWSETLFILTKRARVSIKTTATLLPCTQNRIAQCPNSETRQGMLAHHLPFPLFNRLVQICRFNKLRRCFEWEPRLRYLVPQAGVLWGRFQQIWWRLLRASPYKGGWNPSLVLVTKGALNPVGHQRTLACC